MLFASAIIASLSFSSAASAGDNNINNAWSKCGIGAIIFDTNDVAATLSNIIWDLGTTAVSSKISSVESCNGIKGKVAAAEFIKNTHAQIEQDIAKGSGKYLASMLNILNVQPANQAIVSQKMRQNLASVVSISDADKAEAIYNLAIQSI